MTPRQHAALFALPLVLAIQVVPPMAAHAQNAADAAAAAYCTNLADAAQDARFARKVAHLERVEARIEDRLNALERKRVEYEDWLKKRERFLSLAEEGLVSIYSGMRPDAASEQLAAMDEITAAAVIAKVQPRTASAILNEMDTDKAARLATIVAGMSATEGRAS